MGTFSFSVGKPAAFETGGVLSSDSLSAIAAYLAMVPHLFPDGTAVAPGLAPASAPTIGFYYNGGYLSFATGSSSKISLLSTGIILRNNCTLSWASGAPDGTSPDAALSRIAANALGSMAGADGQTTNIKALTELTTIAAAATTDTTIQIPVGAIVLAVSCRVTVAIPTATAFDVGIAGATTRYSTAVLVAANTTSLGTDDGARPYPTATAIRITPNGTPGANTGRLRVTIHYIDVTPPTS